MEKNDVLSAKGISKAFGEAKVLQNVDFSLKQGEIHALMGENGAGKSTLIKIISGDYTKDSGQVFLDGKQTEFTSPKDAIEAGLRVIHQEINLVKSLSVAENIYLGNFPLGPNKMIDWGKMNRDAQEVLDSLGEPIPSTKKVRSLSIAEQQIVEIAKALSVKPKVLVMDEPTAALNDQETAKLFGLLRGLKNNGVSIIYITHRFSEMYELADRVTVLRDGKWVATEDVSAVTDEKLVKMMAGKEISATFARRRLEKGNEIFSVRNLNVPGQLEDINLTINKGELVVVFGLFGAGQNELCRAIFGDLHVESGEMRLHGKPLSIRSVRQACQAGIGYVSDDRKSEGLIPLLSVQENICLPAYRGKLSRRGVIKLKESARLARTFFDRLRVRCAGPQQAIGSLSGGNQQKCVIGRWLANDAQLLVLNMPTRGVDVNARMEIYRTLEDLAEAGVAILAVSLEMPEVLSIADRIYVMRERKIVGEASLENATQEYLLSMALGVPPSNRCS